MFVFPKPTWDEPEFNVYLCEQKLKELVEDTYHFSPSSELVHQMQVQGRVHKTLNLADIHNSFGFSGSSQRILYPSSFSSGDKNIWNEYTLLRVDFTERQDRLTPLMLACGLGDFNNAKLLVKFGGNVNRLLPNGNTVLMEVIGSTSITDHCKWVKVLLDCGICASVTNHDGHNAVSAAISVGNLGVLEHLIACRPSLNLEQRLTNGSSILHLAVQRNNLDIVHFLVSNQEIDLHMEDQHSLTALCWAHALSHHELACYLSLQLTVSGNLDKYIKRRQRLIRDLPKDKEVLGLFYEQTLLFANVQPAREHFLQEGTLEALISHASWYDYDDKEEPEVKDAMQHERLVQQLSLWFALMSFAMLFKQGQFVDKFLQSDLKNTFLQHIENLVEKSADDPSEKDEIVAQAMLMPVVATEAGREWLNTEVKALPHLLQLFTREEKPDNELERDDEVCSSFLKILEVCIPSAAPMKKMSKKIGLAEVKKVSPDPPVRICLKVNEVMAFFDELRDNIRKWNNEQELLKIQEQEEQEREREEAEKIGKERRRKIDRRAAKKLQGEQKVKNLKQKQNTKNTGLEKAFLPKKEAVEVKIDFDALKATPEKQEAATNAKRGKKQKSTTVGLVGRSKSNNGDLDDVRTPLAEFEFVRYNEPQNSPLTEEEIEMRQLEQAKAESLMSAAQQGYYVDTASTHTKRVWDNHEEKPAHPPSMAEIIEEEKAQNLRLARLNPGVFGPYHSPQQYGQNVQTNRSKYISQSSDDEMFELEIDQPSKDETSQPSLFDPIYEPVKSASPAPSNSSSMDHSFERVSIGSESSNSPCSTPPDLEPAACMTGSSLASENLSSGYHTTDEGAWMAVDEGDSDDNDAANVSAISNGTMKSVNFNTERDEKPPKEKEDKFVFHMPSVHDSNGFDLLAQNKDSILWKAMHASDLEAKLRDKPDCMKAKQASENSSEHWEKQEAQNSSLHGQAATRSLVVVSDDEDDNLSENTHLKVKEWNIFPENGRNDTLVCQSTSETDNLCATKNLHAGRTNDATLQTKQIGVHEKPKLIADSLFTWTPKSTRYHTAYCRMLSFSTNMLQTINALTFSAMEQELIITRGNPTFIVAGIHSDGTEIAIHSRPFVDIGLTAKEMSILKDPKLKCPHIIAAKDITSTNDGVYLATELMEWNLEEYLANLKKDVTFQTHRHQWMKQLLVALGHVHKSGRVHLDLKPANVLIDVKGNIKLAGFKRCQDEGKVSSYESLKFKENEIHWLAREVLQSKKTPNKTFDFKCIHEMQVVGMLLFYIWSSGDFLYEGPDIRKKVLNIVMCKPEVTTLARLPYLLIDLLNRCCSTDLSDRHTPAQLLNHPFFWSKTVKCSFFMSACEMVSVKYYYQSFGRRIIKSLAEKREWMCIGDWRNLVRMNLYQTMEMIGYGPYDYTNIGSLLVFLYDLNRLQLEMPLQLSQMLGHTFSDPLLCTSTEQLLNLAFPLWTQHVFGVIYSAVSCNYDQAMSKVFPAMAKYFQEESLEQMSKAFTLDLS